MFKNFYLALECVSPILIYLIVGYISERAKVIPSEIYPFINRYCYQVLMLILMFRLVSGADLASLFGTKIIPYVLLTTIFVFVFAFFLYSFIEKDRRTRGTLIQNFFRPNLALTGFILTESLTGVEGMRIMSVIMAFAGIIYNIGAVLDLELCRGGKVNTKELFKSIIKNPFIIGTIAALPFLIFRIPVPEIIDTSFNTLGKTGSTMAIIALGASFEFNKLKTNIIKVLSLTSIRLFLVPGLVILISILFGFRGDDLSIIILSFGGPLATSAYTMARVYDSDYELASQLVVSETVFCCFSLFIWIFLLKQIGLI